MAVQYNPAIVTDGLVMYYDGANIKSYPTTGVTWADLTFRGNNGILVNGPVFSTQNGGVISLDGSNDYIKLPNGIFGEGTNPFTISIWFKTTSGGVLLSQAYSFPSDINGDAVAGLYIDSNGKLVTTCFNNGNNNIAGVSTINVNDGKWYNATLTVAFAFTGQVNHISYLNGAQFDSRTRSQPTVALSSGYFLGGGRFFGFAYPNWPATTYLNCQIGNVQLYRKTLSQTEIIQNFNALRGRFGI